MAGFPGLLAAPIALRSLHGATAVMMRGLRRAWHRRRSGIFVPDMAWEI